MIPVNKVVQSPVCGTGFTLFRRLITGVIISAESCGCLCLGSPKKGVSILPIGFLALCTGTTTSATFAT